MSTKIYNGYRLPSMSMVEMKKFLTVMHEKIKPIQIKLARKQFALLCCNFLDRKALGLSTGQNDVAADAGNSAHSYAWNVFENQYTRMTEKPHERNPFFDFGFEVCFFPTKNKTLVLLYTEQPELTKAWESLKNVKEYHYQDQTDKPENISNSLWEKRGDEWNKALGGDGYGIPSECGLTNEVKPPDYFFLTHKELPKILKNMPKFEKRVSRLAKETILNGMVKTDKLSDFWEAAKIFETEEGKKQIETVSIEIRTKLKPKFTKEMLLEKFNT